MKKQQYYLQFSLTHLVMITLCFLLFSGHINAQLTDDCFIRTAIEPDFTTDSYLPVSANSLQSTDQEIEWQNTNEAIMEDGSPSTIQLLAGQQSQAIRLQGFFADIPQGSEIHSVQIRITGSSSDNDILQENNIQFFLGESPIGKNMAGKSNISSPWKSNIHAWNYGHIYSDLDVDWTYEILTSPDLAVQVQLQNQSDSDTLIASIDQLEILVNYTPLTELCSHDCMVFYNDPVDGAIDFLWSVPTGVKFLNDDPTNNVVNLDFSNAEIGILELSLDIVRAADTISCSRFLLHNNCTEASVGDYVFFDENFDGIQDDSDFGLSGIELTLLDPFGESLQSTTTNNDGQYQFTGLEKGFYRIQLIGNDLLPSPQNTTDEDNDSDLQGNFSSSIFYLNGGDSITNIDFGVFEESSISGNVWIECDGNGILNSDEQSANNVGVNLLRENNFIASTITDENGYYLFEQLYPGNYTVILETDDPISEVNHSINTLSSNLFLANKSTDVSLGLSDNRTDINGAIDPKSLLEVMVYFDENGNEVMDEGEDIFNGKSVRIFQDDQMLDEAIVTSGHVQFLALDAEWYTLKIAPEVDYDLLSNSIYETALVDNMIEVTGFTIDCTQANMLQFNFAQANAIMGDYVWLDENRDGIQNTMEQGIAGVEVQLYDMTTAELLSTAITDAVGKYEFLNMQSGNYFLQFIFSEDFTSTQLELDPTKGSKLIQEGDKFIIGPFSYTENESQRNLDAGLVEKLGQISDQVWIDNNRNGQYEENEEGLENVLVSLYNENDDFIAETKTDINGQYSFIVEKGTYYLSFTHEEYVDFVDYDLTLDGATNSDVNPALGNRTTLFAIEIGEIRTDIDAGYIPRTAVIGDFIFLDLNEDGFQDDDEIGLSNFTVEAYNLAGELHATTTSEQGGYYEIQVDPGTYYLKYSKEGFSSSSPNISSNLEKNSDITNSFGENTTELISVDLFEVRTDIDAGFFTVNTLIGDYIWQDQNTNGIQDASEIGMPSMQVNLIKIGEGIIETSYSGNGTDSDRGYYEFIVDQPGDYYLQFVLPDNSWSFTEAGIMDDDLDSDVSFDNGFGTTSTFFLEPGENLLNKDAGVIGTSAIVGDFVWRDDNSNGIQDPDESGVNGMNIFLYDEFFNFIDVTITSYNQSTQQDGYYEFFDLDAGNYILVFDTEDPFVTAFIGSDNALDSDVTSQFVKGSTGIITLSENEKSFHIDAGVLTPTSPTQGSIGDHVWEDLNKNGIFDTGEPGISDVVIELLDENGNVVGETESDLNGMYTFNDIDIGNYKLFVELPDDYEFTIPNNSFDDDTDSDIQSSGETLLFVLAGGENITHVDVGMFKQPGIVQSEEISIQEDLTATEEEDNGVDNPVVGVTHEETVEENGQVENEMGEITISHDFQVYPNPARGFTNIQYEIFQATAVSIELISPQGVILQTIITSQTLEPAKYTEFISLEDYQAGTYFIRMKTDTQLYFKKFIIQ